MKVQKVLSSVLFLYSIVFMYFCVDSTSAQSIFDLFSRGRSRGRSMFGNSDPMRSLTNGMILKILQGSRR